MFYLTHGPGQSNLTVKGSSWAKLCVVWRDGEPISEETVPFPILKANENAMPSFSANHEGQVGLQNRPHHCFLIICLYN